MKKIIGLFALSLCSCFANSSCDPCDDPCPPCPEFTPPPAPRLCAYNAPDYVDLLCQWDVFLTGSFLWLEAKQENMSLGTTISRQYENAEANLPLQIQRAVNMFDFEYKPGFKIGLGIHFDCDNWDLYGEYTYFRSKVNSTIAQVPLNATVEGSLYQSRILPNWYSYDTGENFTEASGTWDLNVDIGDIELARQYYVGRCLTFRTFAGVRGLWIRQEVEAIYGFFNDSTPTGPADPASTNLYTKKAILKSWGVGPRFGVDTNWDLCGGFRIFANPAASILYTKYTNTRQNGVFEPTLDNVSEGSFKDTTKYTGNPCFLRPLAEMTIGLGWGDYFWCNRWYVDLEIGYTVNVFWNQNIFLETNMHDTLSPDFQEYSLPTFVKGGDLYLHGLIVTLRMEF